jgi:hypothetical protein
MDKKKVRLRVREEGRGVDAVCALIASNHLRQYDH